MGLIGGILGGVTSAVGGIMAGKALNNGYKQQQDAYQQQRDMYKQRLADVINHRDALYYQDPTQSAENQAAVTNAQKVLQQSAQQSQNTAVVTGGGEEAAAIQKAAGAAAVANMMQQQAVQGAKQKEAIWNQAEEQGAQYAGQDATFAKYIADSKMAQAKGKAEAITGATKGLASAANGGGLDVFNKEGGKKWW